MTISPVSLADIEQTMAELQQSPGVPQAGPAPASAVDGASGSGDDFATSLAQATGTGTTSDLFADAVAADADPSVDDLSSPLGSSLASSGPVFRSARRGHLGHRELGKRIRSPRTARGCARRSDGIP